MLLSNVLSLQQRRSEVQSVISPEHPNTVAFTQPSMEHALGRWCFSEAEGVQSWWCLAPSGAGCHSSDREPQLPALFPWGCQSLSSGRPVMSQEGDPFVAAARVY